MVTTIYLPTSKVIFARSPVTAMLKLILDTGDDFVRGEFRTTVKMFKYGLSQGFQYEVDLSKELIKRSDGTNEYYARFDISEVLRSHMTPPRIGSYATLTGNIPAIGFFMESVLYYQKSDGSWHTLSLANSQFYIAVLGYSTSRTINETNNNHMGRGIDPETTTDYSGLYIASNRPLNMLMYNNSYIVIPYIVKEVADINTYQNHYVKGVHVEMFGEYGGAFNTEFTESVTYPNEIVQYIATSPAVSHKGAKYYLYGLDSGQNIVQMSEQYNVLTHESNCNKYDYYYIQFLNQYGAWDYIPVYGITKRATTKQEKYKHYQDFYGTNLSFDFPNERARIKAAENKYTISFKQYREFGEYLADMLASPYIILRNYKDETVQKQVVLMPTGGRSEIREFAKEKKTFLYEVDFIELGSYISDI